MKLFLLLLLLYLFSCAYPDIDTVPGFKDLDLSEDELFDLCQLSSTDNNNIDNCLNENKNNQ